MAGTVVVAEAFLNRDTRDSLTAAEQSYLHDSFKYTGGGLVLTALAARSMFRSGVAFRVMSANPCMYSAFRPVSTFLSVIMLYRACTWCESCREHRLYDGSLLHPSRKNRTEAPLLAGKSLAFDNTYFLTLRRGSTPVKQQH